MELIHQLILVKMNIEYVKFFGYAFLVLFIVTFIFFKLEEMYANLQDHFYFLMTKIEKQQEEIQSQRSLISTLISERDNLKLTRRRTTFNNF